MSNDSPTEMGVAFASSICYACSTERMLPDVRPLLGLLHRASGRDHHYHCREVLSWFSCFVWLQPLEPGGELHAPEFRPAAARPRWPSLPLCMCRYSVILLLQARGQWVSGLHSEQICCASWLSTSYKCGHKSLPLWDRYPSESSSLYMLANAIDIMLHAAGQHGRQ